MFKVGDEVFLTNCGYSGKVMEINNDLEKPILVEAGRFKTKQRYYEDGRKYKDESVVLINKNEKDKLEYYSLLLFLEDIEDVRLNILNQKELYYDNEYILNSISELNEYLQDTKRNLRKRIEELKKEVCINKTIFKIGDRRENNCK